MVTRLERTARANFTIDEAFRDKWFKWIVGNTDKVNWSVITYHMYITPEFILANPQYPWDLSFMSLNPNLTIDFVNQHPDKPWDWYLISMNSNLTMKDIKENPDKPWNWYVISRNRNITMKNIKENPDKPWNWDGISGNPNLTVEFIKANLDKPWYLREFENNFNLIGVVPQVNSVEAVVSYLESPFYDNVLRKRVMIRNNMLDLDIIPVEYTAMWDFLSVYCSIDVIMDNIDKPWNWYKIVQQNPNLTLDFIKLYSDKLPIQTIYYNAYVSLDIIQYIIDSYNFTAHISLISYNNNLTTEFIDKYAGSIPLTWSGITRNVKNLTFNFVDKYIDKGLNWDHISSNLFQCEYDKYVRFAHRQYLAVYRIQQWWHKIRLDPRHPIGMKRLEREYDALFGPEAL